MKLTEYLSDKNATAFAAQLGVARRYLYQLAGGHRCPSLGMALAIDRLSGGAVTPYDWPQAVHTRASTPSAVTE